jgi:hypothetical protein
MADEHIQLIEADPTAVTEWDKRVVGALGAVYAARRGVLVLRIIAAVAALAAIIGSALYTFSDANYGGFVQEVTIDRRLVGQFLVTAANPLAFAAVVLALSYLIEISAARLDVDVVVADEDQTAGEFQA